MIHMHINKAVELTIPVNPRQNVSFMAK